MPINLQDIASISGLPGLYRIVRPTRNGVIVESLDEARNRSVAQARQRLSLLQEISIYTTDEAETVPLSEVMNTVQEKYGDTLPVNAKSSGAELASFMESVVPNYDTDRVYTSDMKKLVQWYGIVKQHAFEDATAQDSATEAETKEEAPKKEAKPKAKKEPAAEAGSDAEEEKPKAPRKKKETTKE
ncbi:MAG: hypothetical protein EOO01_40280 [Chitinophagaceae bacterium]|nr:MAG: hypothetical protein EOO01_40280 [Chitinophagaceae bacterium]